MKEIDVSLVVTSSSFTLDDLSARLGRPHSSGSHNLGEPHIRGESNWPETVWRLDSGLPSTAAVEEHLASIQRRFPPQDLIGVLPEGCRIRFDVALFFDTANVGIVLSEKSVNLIHAYGATLEITAYPSDFGES